MTTEQRIENLREYGYLRWRDFISMPDGSGKWITGDGVFGLRMGKGLPKAEGRIELLPYMIKEFDKAANTKISRSIKLPSISYLKRLIGSDDRTWRVCRISDFDMFFNPFLLLEMLKILPGAQAYAYITKARNKTDSYYALYLKSEKGEAILMPIDYRRAHRHAGKELEA